MHQIRLIPPAGSQVRSNSMDLGGDRDNTGKPTPLRGSPIRESSARKKGRGGSSNEKLRNNLKPKERTVIVGQQKGIANTATMIWGRLPAGPRRK